MKARMILVAALALALGGCSTVNSFMAERDLDSANEFCEAKRANPAVRPIAGKLPIVNIDEINAEMLAIQSVPTDAEVEAIRALSRDQRACRDKMRAVVKSNWPTQMPVREQVALRVDLITAELLNKRITFGAANRQYQEAAFEITQKLSDEAKQDIADSRARDAAAWRTVAQGVAAVTRSNQPKSPGPQSCDWTDTSTDCRN